MTDRTEGRFLVTAADGDSAVLRDVETAQVHPLASNPGLERDEVVEAVIEPEPPLEVTWRVVDLRERRTVRLTESDQSPTALARELAADQAVGDVTRRERAGEGELHVVRVPEAETAAAVADVVDDRETVLARAARLGVSTVEVRSAPGVVAVRYLP
jgi:hypothetical protein